MKTFSKKQLLALTFWCEGSRYSGCDALICDGAVRSGKTFCMSLSFVLYAFYRFEGQAFALCGKTVSSLRRNVVTPLLRLLPSLGFTVREKRSQNCIEISRGTVKNLFYLFGGKDESSASLIQGVTLAGVFLDEVALMPRSFVDQAIARCSVAGSKLYFNCNPAGPYHWFYLEWIKKHREKNALYIHFNMEDNPSLSPAIIKRYHSLYSGIFYDRYVKGHWVYAEGLVYPFFSVKEHVRPIPDRPCERYAVSCDYGTVNPTSMGLWGLSGGVWYRLREYYHDSRRELVQKTDEEYYADLCKLVGKLPVEAVVVDPSAASFMACIRRHGQYRVLPADNNVFAGIQKVAEALKAGQIKICEGCDDTLREFSLYRWEENSARDCPRKENDHAMDDIRYFVSTVLCREDGDSFFAVAARRE